MLLSLKSTIVKIYILVKKQSSFVPILWILANYYYLMIKNNESSNKDQGIEVFSANLVVYFILARVCKFDLFNQSDG